MKRLYIISLLLFSSIFICNSQESKPVIDVLQLGTRFSYQYNINSDTTTNNGGFNGEYLTLQLSGNISDKFSFHFFQNLNEFSGTFNSLFDATDYLYLKYDINDNFSLVAGKQFVGIGGWEFDAAPIDIYYYSGFLSNMQSSEFGLAATYTSNDQNHSLTAQVTNSIFITEPFENLYAYSLMWRGTMDWFQSIYSLNFIEYSKGNFINYIILGNRFNFGNNFFYCDITNRAAKPEEFFFQDISLLGHLNICICDKWSVFVKGGYDVNNTQEGITDVELFHDRLVTPGMKYYYVGGGFEFFPLGENKTVRLHAYGAAAHESTTQVEINVGVSWRPNLLKKPVLTRRDKSDEI
ncbi:MAG: porin [Bacteroidales bacterium]|nr:porin [Bacteroidales bacterium]